MYAPSSTTFVAKKLCSEDCARLILYTCLLQSPGGPMLAQVRQSRIALAFALFAASLFCASLSAQTKPRARDLGARFDGTRGPDNAITDVKGVEVGHTTLISGKGKLEIGKGPI